MRDELHELVSRAPSVLQGRNVAREYLQAKVLGALQRAGAMVPLAFQGGTALRFLHRLPRHSEDLDFALEGPRALYDFPSWLEVIEQAFRREGYAIDLKISDERVVHSAFLRFAGLPFELDLSPHRDEVLSVKIEIDTRPPAGAQVETTLVRRYVTLRLQHHDRASLLAGKLHALLERPYVKGRDVYDLVWYLSDRSWPQPNLELLRNALDQTGWSGRSSTDDTWRTIVADRLRDLDWHAVRSDVAPFLEDPAEVDLLTQANLASLLGARSEGGAN